MPYYRQIIIIALLMQIVVSCLARTRFIPDPWPASVAYWNDVEEIDNNDNNNNINDNDLPEKSVPSIIKAKKAFRSGYHSGNEDRRKKYLGELSNFQSGHSLQGLWAMPGRR